MPDIPSVVLDEIIDPDWGTLVADTLDDLQARMATAESTDTTQTSNISSLTTRMGSAETDLSTLHNHTDVTLNWRQNSTIVGSSVSPVKFNFDSNIWGPNNMSYSSGTWTIQRAGLYLIQCSFSMASGAVTTTQVRVNGSVTSFPAVGIQLLALGVGYTVEVWASATTGAVYAAGCQATLARFTYA